MQDAHASSILHDFKFNKAVRFIRDAINDGSIEDVEKLHKIQYMAALLIQSRWRSKHAKRKMRLHQREKDEAILAVYAVRIQRAFRIRKLIRREKAKQEELRQARVQMNPFSPDRKSTPGTPGTGLRTNSGGTGTPAFGGGDGSRLARGNPFDSPATPESIQATETAATGATVTGESVAGECSSGEKDGANGSSGGNAVI